jgi:hypothetical protein
VFYISSLQFHDIALPDDMTAGIGTADSGPAPGNQTSVGQAPAPVAAVVNGEITITWTGNSYSLQETTDLGSGEWDDSAVSFTESSDTSGNVTTTAKPASATDTPAKFYRLVFRP